MIVTAQYLRDNPDHIFVFGDNTIRKGKGGAAKLRDFRNAYGFITKKYPNNLDRSFYGPKEYQPIFEVELAKLIKEIESHNCFYKEEGNDYLISKLGAGLANRYGIWEHVIEPRLNLLANYSNVTLLWE